MTDTLWSPSEFATWINGTKIRRGIKQVQLHHTWKPGYSEFKGFNHQALQQGMRAAHKAREFDDIAMQLAIYPDGTVVSGRPFEKAPAGIRGQNATGVCVECVGNFDIGGDVMTPEQRDAIVAVTAILCRRFAIEPTTRRILYHHWFDLTTGRRTPTGPHKTCPGTGFFGGNGEADCEREFLPLVRAAMVTP